MADAYKDFVATMNKEDLFPLIKSNISCHYNKILNEGLIEEIALQIIESIGYFINKED